MTEEEFWAALTPLPNISLPIYRLYYDNTGIPLFYSMEDLPGKYVEIDQPTFALSPTNVRVVDGKLKYLKSNTVLRLHPGDTGTPCHTNNISVVVSPEEPHIKWTLK